MKFSAPNKENHYALWMWLHKNPAMPNGELTHKENWPGLNTMASLDVPLPSNDCFACSECGIFCEYCPINWGAKYCDDSGTLYDEWVKSRLPADRAKYAKMIAEAWK